MIKKDKYKEAYNKQSKRILGFKFVIAKIMQECLEEYQDCDLQTIIHLIEKDLGNGDKIIGYTNDFDDVRLDLFFSAALPNSNDSIGMYIDLEPQKTTKIGYQIHNRALLYSGYELVFQHGRNIVDSQYDNLKKIVSIWICFDAPTIEEENSITYFHLTKDVKLGYNIVEPKEYDKLKMIIIYMGEKTSNHHLLEFIDLLFTNQISVEDKIQSLENKLEIEVPLQFKKEAEEMSGLADRIEERAMKKGLEQGVMQGEFNQAYSNILNIIDSLKCNFEDAVNILKLNDKLRKVCKEKYELEKNDVE